MLVGRAVLAGAVIFGVSATASAHLRLTSHEARYGDTQKVGPCGMGNGPRTTDKVYTAKPGTQVMLIWDEFVEHPSHFRIAFDDDGQDFQDPHQPCGGLQDNPEECFVKAGTDPYIIYNIPDAQIGGIHNYLYTLPNIECDNCTLQIIQAMYDKPPLVSPGNDIYYQCIDLILDANGPDVLTKIETGGPIDMTPTPGGGATNTCSLAGGAGLWAFGLALLAFRRRRRY